MLPAAVATASQGWIAVELGDGVRLRPPEGLEAQPASLMNGAVHHGAALLAVPGEHVALAGPGIAHDEQPCGWIVGLLAADGDVNLVDVVDVPVAEDVAGVVRRAAEDDVHAK